MPAPLAALLRGLPLLGFLLVMTPWPGYGAEGRLPPVLERALSLYAEQGLEALVPALVQGGPLEGQALAREQTRVLRRIEGFYGRYRGHELLHETALGSRSHLVYFVLHYDKGAVFGKALLYGKRKTATVSSFNFHTRPEELLPAQWLVTGTGGANHTRVLRSGLAAIR